MRAPSYQDVLGDAARYFSYMSLFNPPNSPHQLRPREVKLAGQVQLKKSESILWVVTEFLFCSIADSVPCFLYVLFVQTNLSPET